jgi:hypothetical protein
MTVKSMTPTRRTGALALGILLGLLGASAAAAPPTPQNPRAQTAQTGCGLESCATLAPTLYTGALETAKRGLVVPGVWNSVPWWSTGSRVDSLTTNAAAQSQLPHAAIREYRLPWSQLETQDGVYQTAAVQALIDSAKTAGDMVGFRLIAYMPQESPPSGTPRGVPEWFITAGTARGECTSIGSGPAYLGRAGGGPDGNCAYYRARFLKGSCAYNAGQDKWLNSDGAVCAPMWMPNYNEPPGSGQTFRERYTALIAWFRTSILTPANVPWIAYIDTGGWGDWGEMHTHNTRLHADGTTRLPTPNTATFTALLDEWWKVPDTIPLLTNFQAATLDSAQAFSTSDRTNPLNFDGWRAVCSRAIAEGFGGQMAAWRTDGMDAPDAAINTAWQINLALRDFPELGECWRYGPINGEPAGAFATPTALSASLDWFGSTVSAWPWPNGAGTPGPRGSMFNGKYINLTTTFAAAVPRIQTFNAAVGYRIYPSAVLLPSAPSAGESWSVRVTIKNAGPHRLFSYLYAPAIRFVPSAGAPTTLALGADLARLEQGQEAVASRRGITLPAGTYTVRFGIAPKPGVVTPVPVVSPSLDPASCTTDADGSRWCTLGSLTVDA